jgi:hypothetical protein
MGVDISGWVEFEPDDAPGYWQPLIRIDDLVHRSYGMFASLVGVRNNTHGFQPIAPNRGEPPHCSWLYKQDRAEAGGVVNETWVLWSELLAVDWDEEGQAFIDEEGKVRSTPERGGKRERRKDYLHSGWAALVEMMRIAAQRFGADNVRLSVWFDQP